VLHVQSAGRGEVRAGDVLAAALQETRSFAAQTLLAQGVTRLDILNFISHGIRKVPDPLADQPDAGEIRSMPAGDDEVAPVARDPLAAYGVNLSERAAAGLLDPLIGGTRNCSARSKCFAGAGRTALSSWATPALARPPWPRGCATPPAGRRARGACRS
jgi:ATP-dependent Clp protease ATP-binding subunit ClpA